MFFIDFRGGSLNQLTLHPIEFGFGLPRAQFGRPMLSSGNIAQQALERFQRLSAPYGTQIDITGDAAADNALGDREMHPQAANRE